MKAVPWTDWFKFFLTMKMAKAPREEWEACMKFVHELEAEIKWPEKSEDELRAWISAAPCLFRVVFGYQVLVDHCADPASSYLDFKPEIKAAIESNTELTGALRPVE